MRIGIFGSSSTREEVGKGISAPPETVENFCLNLGLNLAGTANAILVESDKPRTADRHVVNGFLSVPRNRRAMIWVFHRQDVPAFDAESKMEPQSFRFFSQPSNLLSPIHLRMLDGADAAIVVGGGAHAYAAGVAAAMLGVRLMPVAAFGGAGELLYHEFSHRPPRMRLPTLDTWNQLGSREIVLEAISAEIRSLPRIMIVHGRSRDRDDVVKILRSLGVQKPVVVRELFSPGQTILEKFEGEAQQADAALALFTPDDEAASLLDPSGNVIHADELKKRARARQNVSIEYGWFWGKLGRKRVLLLLKGELEVPSDLSGLEYQWYRESPHECREAIKEFVEAIQSHVGPEAS